MSKLLIAYTWSFTEGFHEITIAFDFRFFVFLWFLADCFDFVFFDIPPCICGRCFCNFLVPWRLLLLMFIVPLFDNLWLLLEPGPSRLLRHTSMLLYFFNFCCFDKFFRENAILLSRLDRFLSFNFSNFRKGPIHLIVWKVFKVVKLNRKLVVFADNGFLNRFLIFLIFDFL